MIYVLYTHKKYRSVWQNAFKLKALSLSLSLILSDVTFCQGVKLDLDLDSYIAFAGTIIGYFHNGTGRLQWKIKLVL